jgi:hypothetical protein
VKLTTHLYLVPRSRTLGAISPLFQYSSMAWCPVKAKGKLKRPIHTAFSLLESFCFILYCKYTCNSLPEKVKVCGPIGVAI